MSEPFRLDAPLPRRSLVIEASAGTGKTYSLAALATRLIAERRVRASELLVVTFTRAATAELRDRLRTRIADAAGFLAGIDAADVDPDTDDPVHAHLASLPDRARILADLERAVTEFDAATISTIHGFATQVLGLLGLTDADETGLADDNDELTLAICADVLAGAAADGTPAEHLPKFEQLAANVQLLLQRPGLSLVPEPDPTVCGPDLVERAETVRGLIDRCLRGIRDQRRRSGRRSFGDMLTLLQDELRSERAEIAAELVRTRYRAALIDEFQDTDPVQWDIFRTLFDGRDDTDLVLVGDPKQAIYAFRGADVHTYLRAVRDRPETRSLTVNWRSDGAALAAVDTLFDGITFGSEAIGFTAVRPAEKHLTRRLRRADGTPLPGLQIRHRTTSGVRTGKPVCGEPSVAADPGRAEVYRDLANTIIELLDDAQVPHGDQGETVALRPGDIAVLVPSTVHAEDARQVLLDHGIPAVLARGRSVLESPAARHWRWLLEAVARPADHRRARAFALSWFGEHDPASLDAATDEDVARVQDLLWTWSGVLNDLGLEAFLRRVVHDSGVIPRVLGTADGDRDVTDLEHIAELFRTERPRDRAGAAGLLAVLKDRKVGGVATNPNADYEGDSSSRRVASEVDAVQIMTVWVAKGLEFPVVCCPTLWCAGSTDVPIIHPAGDERFLDVLKMDRWPDKAGHDRRRRLSTAERDGEALRLLYVALTRARHQTILWWARGFRSQGTALGRVLFGRDGEGAVDPEVLGPDGGSAAVIPPEADCAAHLGRLASRAGERADLDEPVIEVVTVDSVPHGRRLAPSTGTEPAPDLALARLERTPPRLAARWSFSRISARAGDLHDNIDEPAEPGPDAPDHPLELGEPITTGAGLDPVTDPIGAVDPVAPLADLDAPDVSPFAPLPASAAFGLLVHAIYEHVDFTDEQLEASIADRLGRELGHRAIDLTPQLPADATAADGRRRVVDGIAASLRTPLGDDLHGLRLADVGRRDRLDELDFELHLPHPGRPVSDRQLGAVLLARLDPDDPFLPWAKRVADGTFDVDLAGHLTGSIDLVLRVRGADPETPDRYLVCDYKTNRLHDPSAPPRPDDYGRARLVEEMSHAHYPLQALLYSVALHRHLRGRLPGYDPSRHLGGVRYLFVRGMAGPDTAVTGGQPHGVCRWDPAPAAITAVSDLLAGVAVHELCDPEARP